MSRGLQADLNHSGSLFLTLPCPHPQDTYFAAGEKREQIMLKANKKLCSFMNEMVQLLS